MRATSILTKLLAIEQTRVIGFELEEDAVVFVVKSRKKVPRCGGCWRKCRFVHDRRHRRWRHLDVMGIECWLAGEVRRVRCPRCGVTTEMVPWAAPDSGFTRDFETTLAFLAQRMDKTTVTRMMRVAWKTVGRVAARVAERMRVKDPLDGLKHIAIDELSYKKHHHYITIVINELGEVVWASPGKSADTLRPFFDQLGEIRAAALETVSVDLSPAFTLAVQERCPNATIVYDRFHVQRLAHDALDRVRREEVRVSLTTSGASAIKNTRWALHKSPWNLTEIDNAKLATVQRTNKTLYRAYLLKETLAAILDGRQVHVARTKLLEWIDWANRSRLKAFRRAARTIAEHIDGILAYVRTGLSNARAEARIGTVRTITKRSFGFHDPYSLIGLIMLCCSGLVLAPAFHGPVLPPTC
jgi:transposase